MNGKPNRRNKAAVLNFEGVMWTGLGANFYIVKLDYFCFATETFVSHAFIFVT